MSRLGLRAFLMFVLVLGAIVSPTTSHATQLTLTWTDNSTNEDGFSIERKIGPTGTFAQIATIGANATSYIDSTVASATTYCYRLLAFNVAGNSAYSSEACGTPSQTFGLAVVEAGMGSGTVTSTPAGITCGTSCSSSYTSGTAVTLTATPATGSTFTGWSGCTGTASCTVTVIATTTVTATFDAPTVALTVTKAGTGSGTVTSTPAGITCGPSCSTSYPNGTAVTLTASPATGSSFTGWSGGGCSGKGSCTVTISAGTTVTANFNVRSHGHKGL